ncbi:MAG: 4-hydroxythreonine-4-phosphate dehydrogenase PdxA [bacterium]|nr:4-hydroxythreonine-4-phosphate dehydrogenase PdxA [bacterium]
MRPRPKIGITLGDPGGIGPEVILRALTDPAVRSAVSPLVLGDLAVLTRLKKILKIRLPLEAVSSPRLEPSKPGAIPVWNLSELKPGEIAAREFTPELARACRTYLENGVALARAGTIRALVTGPVPKAVFRLSGLAHPGHTEFLAERTGADDYAMMFVGGNLRVVLATIHLPLARVPRSLSREGILKKLRLIHREFRRLFRISRPRIAVAGLNPHAGEEGLLGREEIEVIRPAVAAARKAGIRAEGPFPADALFGRFHSGEYDCLLAMYHDQGLAAFKTLHFYSGVNVTLGLPIIRTSPDHGTARDIAGKGIADPASMKNAILLAAQFASK